MEKTWNRVELKERGKAAFKKNYWAAVIISVILAIVTAGGNSNGSDSNSNQTYHYEVSEDGELIEQQEHGEEITYMAGELAESVNVRMRSPLGVFVHLFKLRSVLIILLLGVVSHFLVGNVLEMGCCGFYIENMYSNPKVGRVLGGFRSGAYGNIVKTMFFRDVYILLWTLLLIVPGIVKGYEYRLVPYLLAENPDMPVQEVLERSKELMYGQKMDAFVLDLSFFLWNLLSAVTLGIAGVFYVNPYVDATNAELYDTLTGDCENYSYSE